MTTSLTPGPRRGKMRAKEGAMSMNVNYPPAAPRQFVAEPPFWGSKMASMTTPAWQKNPGKSYAIMVVAILGFTVVASALVSGIYFLIPQDSLATIGPKVIPALGLLLIAGFAGWYLYSRSGSQKIVISVANDGLTVSTRPG